MDEDDVIDLDTGKCFHRQAVPSLKLPTGGCLTHSICPPAPHCPRQPPPRRRRRPGGWHLSFRRQAVNMLRSLVKILGLTDFRYYENLKCLTSMPYPDYLAFVSIYSTLASSSP